MKIERIDDLIAAAAQRAEKKTVAVACAADADVLSAVLAAQRAGVSDAILIGRPEEIRQQLAALAADADTFPILPAETPQEAARLAVSCVRDGRAELLMKGLLDTATLLRAVLNHDDGIACGGLLTHLMFYDVPQHRLFCLTDGGLNTFPDLEKKRRILTQAAEAMHKLGRDTLYAACVCGAETVNPKIPSNLDAQALQAENPRWQRELQMTVYGPVGLDIAVSKAAAQHKRYTADGAGEADILLVPNYEVGNGIGKALTCFAGAKNAGVVVGAAAPIVLVSRADSAQSKLASIALASLLTP